MTLVLYDFEVFKYDWLVVSFDIGRKEKTVIVNDSRKMKDYYKKHKNDIWVGYNSRNYDQYVLKAILSDLNPKDVTDHIIAKGKSGYSFNRKMNDIQLYNYDVFINNSGSLKTLEAYMGNNIKETSVPFDIDRKLTPEEIAETIKYCEHDVSQLGQVFLLRKDDFDTHINLIKEFELPLDAINKTTAQLIAQILKATPTKLDDEYDIILPDTLKLGKYQKIADWFLYAKDDIDSRLTWDYCDAKKTMEDSFVISELKKAEAFINKYENEKLYTDLFKERFYESKLEIEVAGVPHTFAWGGVHGAIPKFIYECQPDELMIMADVTSLYPSLMLQYDLQSRAISDKSIYRKIYDTNIEMKKNKDPKRPIYKLICNTTYGCMGDKFNPLYDQKMRNLVCVFGQVLILDLIEKLEPYCKLIQSNTDGILILIKRKDFDTVDDIVAEWEDRTRLSMEFDYFKKIVQKDVNNYVAIDKDGHYKSKGAYVKKLSTLDNDLPIVNEAIVNFIVHDIPVEKTIGDCKELIKFQKVYKLSSSYKLAMHNGRMMDQKSYRVFASKNIEDTFLGKVKPKGTSIEKFAGCPDHCFIVNDDIKTTKVPDNLDREWYIQLAKDRLEQFGFDFTKKLFM